MCFANYITTLSHFKKIKTFVKAVKCYKLRYFFNFEWRNVHVDGHFLVPQNNFLMNKDNVLIAHKRYPSKNIYKK